MAVKLRPLHEDKLHFAGLSNMQILVLALEASQKLEWSIEEITLQGTVLNVPFTMESQGEEITLNIVEGSDGEISVRSQSLSIQFVDFGKNRKNIRKLRETMEEVLFSFLALSRNAPSMYQEVRNEWESGVAEAYLNGELKDNDNPAAASSQSKSVTPQFPPYLPVGNNDRKPSELYKQSDVVINGLSMTKTTNPLHIGHPDEPGEDIEQIVLKYFQKDKLRIFVIVMHVRDKEAQADLEAIASSIQITK